MPKTDLVKRSPIRVLDKTLRGGLGKGGVGVLASRKGVGKTACLVHIALDKMLQDKPVIHVSYSSRVDHIIKWYEDLFREISRKPRLKDKDPAALFEDLIRNRVIMNFRQEGTKTEQILRSVEALIVHTPFAAETVIVDGYDFAAAEPEDLVRFRDFAVRRGLEIWFSASLKGPQPLFNEEGVPRLLDPYLDLIDVLMTLRFQGEQVGFHLIRHRDRKPRGRLRLTLDPTTLLIAREKTSRPSARKPSRRN